MILLAPIMPLLADWDAIVPVVFFLIAFGSWLTNFAKQNKAGVGKKPGPSAGRPAGSERAKSIQEQIDSFLQQARDQVNSGSRTSDRSEGIEVIRRPAEPQRRRAAPPSSDQSTRRRKRRDRSRESGQPNRQATATGTSQKSFEAQSASIRPGEGVSQRHLDGTVNTAQVAQDVGRLSTSVFDRQVSQDMQSRVSRDVNARLGTFQAGLSTSAGERAIAETRDTKETAARRVAAMMRSGQTVRDALIISEILRKPRALQK